MPALCRKIWELKRRRDTFLKLRIRCLNSLTAAVANVLGYGPRMTEKEREAHWKRARRLVKDIVGVRGDSASDTEEGCASTDDEGRVSGDVPCDTEVRAAAAAPALPIPPQDLATITCMVSIMLPSFHGKQSFDGQVKMYERQMEKIAEQLPVFPWANAILGVGALTLANIVGETGDLSNYANPGKVWRRMGCAPFTSQGETHMGSTWRNAGTRKDGKAGWVKFPLHAEQWTEYAYCGRRRSVVYNLTASIKKACCGKNAGKAGADNDYIRRYHEAKATAAAQHLDWTPIHVENHALLLMGKRFLRDLWRQWRGGADGHDTEKRFAPSP